MNPFCSIPNAIDELRKGKMLIVVDSSNRENQGDLIFPAQAVTVDKVNFLLKECRGMICVALTRNQAVALDLPLMVPPIDNTEATKVQFTVTVDAKNVRSFGISARDRVRTIKVLAKKTSLPDDLVRPGHVFPLLARDGGIRERQGHTEATIDLCRLADFKPVGVLCEILNNNGQVASLPELIEFAKKYQIKMVSIDDLFAFVKEKPLQKPSSKRVIKTASAFLPTVYGKFNLSVYKSVADNQEHILLRLGESLVEPVITRIHSQCVTGDTFHSLKCDCYAQLQKSLKIISKKGQGILFYLNQEGRGIGLTNKIKAYFLQDKGLDTVEANQALGLPIDARDYALVAEILHDQGISSIILITNNPKKVDQLSKFGIEIVNQLALETRPHDLNKSYLKAKKQKLGHYLKKV